MPFLYSTSTLSSILRLTVRPVTLVTTLLSRSLRERSWSLFVPLSPRDTLSILPRSILRSSSSVITSESCPEIRLSTRYAHLFVAFYFVAWVLQCQCWGCWGWEQAINGITFFKVMIFLNCCCVGENKTRNGVIVVVRRNMSDRRYRCFHAW